MKNLKYTSYEYNYIIIISKLLHQGGEKHRMFQIILSLGYAVSKRILRFYAKYCNIYTGVLDSPNYLHIHMEFIVVVYPQREYLYRAQFFNIQ